MNTGWLVRCILAFLIIFPQYAFSTEVTEKDVEIVKSIERVIEYVSEKVKPAVVNISTVSTVKVNHPAIPPEFREFFREFGVPFPNFPEEFKTHSLGSGFIVKVKKGWAYIITNNHVIAKADKIKVRLSDGDVYSAKIVGKDSKTDIAVIKIKVGNKSVTTVELGDSDKIRTGDFVIAIGNPYGLNWTVTHGIISAKGRHGLGINPIENFIQTDAAINPGNSGGPLCDIHGKVIGINTAIVRNAQGLGFAVPINIAKKVMNDILNYGKVIRGWLGVYIQDLSSELSKKFSIEHGVLVTKVIKGSPADKAGLKSGDIILKYNGKVVKSVSDLQLKVINTKPGSIVRISILRDGDKKDIKVKIGQLEEAVASKLISIYGFTVQDLTDELKRKLGLPKNINGIVVTEVKPGSIAYDSGLREGDVIVKAGTVPRKMVEVRNKRQFLNIVKQSGNKGLLVKILRGDSVLYVVLRPED